MDTDIFELNEANISEVRDCRVNGLYRNDELYQIHGL